MYFIYNNSTGGFMNKMTDISQYTLLHGNKYISDLKMDEQLLNTISKIADLDTSKLNNIDCKYILRRNIKKHGEEFFKKYFKLHSVGYLSDSHLSKIFHKKNINNIDKIVDLYNNSATFVSPFKLPVYYKYKELFSGTLVTQTLITNKEEQNNKLLKNINMYFSGIILPKTNTEISTTCYIHEITHCQLESFKGVIDDYNNEEVISIFLELLYSYLRDKNIHKIVLLNRIEHLILCYGNILDYDKKEKESNNEINSFNNNANIKYLKSILKAFKMFDEFQRSNIEIKKYYINQIQKSFNGESTVEEILSNLEISFSESIDSKYVKRIVNRVTK